MAGEVTCRCGPSSPSLPSSSDGDPIVNDPAGTTTISGQNAHGLPSLNVSVNTCPAVRDERRI